MKKFLMAMVLCLVCTMSFGQESRIVYRLPMGYGEITYVDSCYIYWGVTDDETETKRASIVLGCSKETAINTLNVFKTLKLRLRRGNMVIVQGYDTKTRIYHSRYGIGFHSQGVRGNNWTLNYNDWKKSIKAIESFNE